MRPFSAIIFLISLLGSIRAEGYPIIKREIKGQAKDALYGEWLAQTVATDPKFHLVFKIDKKGNVIHYVYTGWQWKTKRLFLTMLGSIDTKTFEKNRKLNLRLKDSREFITYKVRFVEGGVQFLRDDLKEESDIYDHQVFKNTQNKKMQ